MTDSIKEDVKRRIIERGQNAREILEYFRPYHEGGHTSFFDNEEIAILLVERKGSDLFYIEESLCDSDRVVLPAVENDGLALEHASKGCRDNKTIVLAAVKQNGMALKFASERLCDDKDVVLAAIESKADAFIYASPNIRKDKAVILASLNNGASSQVFKSIVSKFWSDKDIVIAALKISSEAVRFIDKELWEDRDVVLTALERGYVSVSIADKFHDDEEVMLAHAKACKCTSVYVETPSPRLAQDTGFLLKMFEAANNNFNISKFAENREFVLGALKIDVVCVCKDIIREYYSKDKEMIKSVVEVDSIGLSYADPQLQDDAEFVYELARIDFNVMRWASDNLKKNKDFMLSIVKINGLALIYADKKLQDDLDVVLAAVANNLNAIQYASRRLQKKLEKFIKFSDEGKKYLDYDVAVRDLKRPRFIANLFTRKKKERELEAHASDYRKFLDILKNRINLMPDDARDKQELMRTYEVINEFFENHKEIICDDIPDRVDDYFDATSRDLTDRIDNYYSSVVPKIITVDEIDQLIDTIEREDKRIIFQVRLDFVKSRIGELGVQACQPFIDSLYEEVCTYKGKEIVQNTDGSGEKKI